MKLSETDALDESIRQLKRKQKEEWVILKEQAHLTYEGLKPINLLKKTLQQIAGSAEIKSNIATTLVALATAFLSKRAVMGVSHNPYKKILGTLFQFGIAKLISSNTGSIKLQMEKLLLRVFGSKNKAEHEYSHNGHG